MPVIAKNRPVDHSPATSAAARGRGLARLAELLGRHPHLFLAALALLVAVPYAVLGVGFVLDDWFALANAHFDGALAAAGHEQWLARPGQGLVYFLTFGLIGEHPLVFYAVQVVLSAVAAVLLYRLLHRLLEPTMALAVAALWVVIPNHGSLVRWPSAVGILVALILLLAAGLALTAPRPSLRTDIGAALLLAASVLCYEATAPAGAAAALVLPYLAHRRWRWRVAILGCFALGVAVAWMLIFFHPAKAAVHVTADLTQMVPAHFGWGIAPKPGPAAVVGLLGLLGLVAVIVKASTIGGRARQVDWLVVAGLAIIVLGTLPFVRYYYAPLGAGDRANVVAGIGTALCWCGLARLAWRWWRPFAAAATLVVVASMAAAGIEGDRAWHGAAELGRRVLAAVPAEAPEGTLVVGPEPVQVRNVAPFLDRSNIEPAIQLRLDDPSVTARLSYSLDDFVSVPISLRIDTRRL